ncbi:hypothetical protein L2089_15380 [Paenibacillus hunanensis]|uniref:hypothetical protein n=1 Tax=Paenibacillus hunanensis TaxID=539262 RepID=UPI002025DF99|nr:hypothetical protein [Paenibacillus hunanensis]MCL9662075.1 hypothetical protein [Paenibacillus hunanensis]
MSLQVLISMAQTLHEQSEEVYQQFRAMLPRHLKPLLKMEPKIYQLSKYPIELNEVAEELMMHTHAEGTFVTIYACALDSSVRVQWVKELHEKHEATLDIQFERIENSVYCTVSSSLRGNLKQTVEMDATQNQCVVETELLSHVLSNLGFGPPVLEQPIVHEKQDETQEDRYDMESIPVYRLLGHLERQSTKLGQYYELVFFDLQSKRNFKAYALGEGATLVSKLDLVADQDYHVQCTTLHSYEAYNQQIEFIHPIS